MFIILTDSYSLEAAITAPLVFASVSESNPFVYPFYGFKEEKFILSSQKKCKKEKLMFNIFKTPNYLIFRPFK
jgi:hypothetical protein